MRVWVLLNWLSERCMCPMDFFCLREVCMRPTESVTWDLNLFQFVVWETSHPICCLRDVWETSEMLVWDVCVSHSKLGVWKILYGLTNLLSGKWHHDLHASFTRGQSWPSGRVTWGKTPIAFFSHVTQQTYFVITSDIFVTSECLISVRGATLSCQDVY